MPHKKKKTPSKEVKHEPRKDYVKDDSIGLILEEESFSKSKISHRLRSNIEKLLGGQVSLPQNCF